MATNHTDHYQLHLWEPGDSFLREEFNENTGRIDNALAGKAEAAAVATLAEQTGGKCGIMVGSYQGTAGYNQAGSQSITLGVRPKAVVVWGNYRDNDIQRMGGYTGMAVDGAGLTGALSISGDGFVATSSDRFPKLNDSSYTYLYMALI